MKLSRRISKLKSGNYSIRKNTKGNNCAKNVGGVTVVNLCTFSARYISTKFCEIILNGIIEPTKFHY